MVRSPGKGLKIWSQDSNLALASLNPNSYHVHTHSKTLISPNSLKKILFSKLFLCRNFFSTWRCTLKWCNRLLCTFCDDVIQENYFTHMHKKKVTDVTLHRLRVKCKWKEMSDFETPRSKLILNGAILSHIILLFLPYFFSIYQCMIYGKTVKSKKSTFFRARLPQKKVIIYVSRVTVGKLYISCYRSVKLAHFEG